MATQRLSGPRRSGVRWTAAAAVVAALLWLAPLVAMQFSDEVAWSAADFAAFGAMLLIGVGTTEWLVRRPHGAAYRAAVVIALTTALVLVAANGAVGIVGSETDPVNRLVAGVVAVGVIGAVLARGRPRGMARASAATAVAQLGFASAAAGAGGGAAALVAILACAAAWGAAAALFGRAARADRGDAGAAR
jgi:hypothetical protein